ncbi:MAG: hypothetical protein Q9227_000060 [Pyrenula ochraceoflavens]
MTVNEWRPLPRTQQDGGPETLLFRFPHSQKGFHLFITDLFGIWETTKSREDILQQALSEKSSIDASDQYDLLLDKLSGSLRGCDNATVFLHPHSGKNGIFEIRISAPLPMPLKPLTWTFVLSPRHSNHAQALSQEIVAPALQEKAHDHDRINSLIKLLQQKDHVIRRLLDKIEGSSIDLVSVFPGIGSSKNRQKKLDTEQIAALVPGLALFNESAWNDEHSQTPSEACPTITGILETLGQARIKMLAEDRIHPTEGWTAQIHEAVKDKTVASSEQKAPNSDREPRLRTSERNSKWTASSDSDDALLFQRQKDTDPTAIKPDFTTDTVARKNTVAKSRGRTISPTSSGTDSDPQADSPSDSPHDRSLHPSASIKHGKRIEESEGSSTDSGGEEVSKPVAKTSSRLGRIGRPHNHEQRHRELKASTPDPPSASEGSSLTPKKIGRIGGRLPSASQIQSENLPLPRYIDHNAGHAREVSNLCAPATATSSVYLRGRENDFPQKSPGSLRTPQERNSSRVNQSPNVLASRSRSREKGGPDPETQDEKTARKREEIKRIEEGPVKKKKRKF